MKNKLEYLGMKILILALILTAFSCTKTVEVQPVSPCYECTVYAAFDQPIRKETHCTNRPDTLYFMDATGSPLQSYCEKK